MRSMGEGHPPVVAISRSCPVETLRQYNLAQRREDKKKVLARPVIVQGYFGDDADVAVSPAAYNNLVHCHRNSESTSLHSSDSIMEWTLLKSGGSLRAQTIDNFI